MFRIHDGLLEKRLEQLFEMVICIMLYRENVTLPQLDLNNHANLIQIEPSQAEPQSFPQLRAVQVWNSTKFHNFGDFPLKDPKLSAREAEAIRRRFLCWDSPVLQNCKDEAIFWSRFR